MSLISGRRSTVGFTTNCDGPEFLPVDFGADREAQGRESPEDYGLTPSCLRFFCKTRPSFAPTRRSTGRRLARMSSSG
jgi:hypothetical protein